MAPKRKANGRGSGTARKRTQRECATEDVALQSDDDFEPPRVEGEDFDLPTVECGNIQGKRFDTMDELRKFVDTYMNETFQVHARILQ